MSLVINSSFDVEVVDERLFFVKDEGSEIVYSVERFV